MSVAQALAVRFELAHAARNCPDPRRRWSLLVKMGKLDEQIKAGEFGQGWQPGSKRRVYARS
ncbi:MAG TPA: hypothetical protein DCY27_13205 [Desulfobacterales bacterium]|nr:hypothetical protein [Desulfobacterales bacterium]